MRVIKLEPVKFWAKIIIGASLCFAGGAFQRKHESKNLYMFIVGTELWLSGMVIIVSA